MKFSDTSSGPGRMWRISISSVRR